MSDSLQESAPRARGARGVLRHPLFRLAVGLTILGALLAIVPLDDLWLAVRGVSPALWLACLAGFVAGHAVGAFKWGLLIGAGGERPAYGELFRCHFAGLFANLFLPSVAGGDVVRAGLALRTSERRAAVVLGSVVDRVIDTGTLALLVVAGGLLAAGGPELRDTRLVFALLGVIAAGGVAGLVALFAPLPAWVPPVLGEARDKLRGAALALARRPAAALLAFGLSLGIQSLFVTLNAVLGRACGIDLPLAAWFFAWPLAKLAAMLPVTLAGIGVREAALAGLLGRFGVGGALAVAVGLLWETILVAAGAFGGIFYSLVRRGAPGGEPATS